MAHVVRAHAVALVVAAGALLTVLAEPDGAAARFGECGDWRVGAITSMPVAASATAVRATAVTPATLVAPTVAPVRAGVAILVPMDGGPAIEPIIIDCPDAKAGDPLAVTDEGVTVDGVLVLAAERSSVVPSVRVADAGEGPNGAFSSDLRIERVDFDGTATSWTVWIDSDPHDPPTNAFRAMHAFGDGAIMIDSTSAGDGGPFVAVLHGPASGGGGDFVRLGEWRPVAVYIDALVLARHSGDHWQFGVLQPL